MLAGAGSGKTRVLTYADRAPRRGARRRPRSDPGGDLHEQGGRRDARAGRAAPLGRSRPDLDRHLPRDRRPAPPAATRRASAGRRTSPSTTATRRCGRSSGSWSAQDLRQACHPRAVLAASRSEEPARRARGVRDAGARTHSARSSPKVYRVPDGAAGAERLRLRRSPRASPSSSSDRTPTSSSSSATASASSSSTSTRTRTTRSTLHRAARPRPREHRWSSATTTSRSTVARRRHPQHPRLREGLPRGARRAARAELPLDGEDPRGREPRDRGERAPQGQDAPHRCGRRRARHVVGPPTSRTRRNGSLARSRPALPRTRSSRPVTSSSSTDERPVARPRRVFLRRDLPYQIVGGTRFYERREIMDVLAYLRLINEPARRRRVRSYRELPAARNRRHLDGARPWAGPRSKGSYAPRGSPARAPGSARPSRAARGGRSPGFAALIYQEGDGARKVGRPVSSSEKLAREINGVLRCSWAAEGSGR